MFYFLLSLLDLLGFFCLSLGLVSFIFLDAIVAPFLSSSVTSVARRFILKYEVFCFFGFSIWVGSLFVSFRGLHRVGVAFCMIDRLCFSVCFTGTNNHSDAWLFAFPGL